MDHLLNGQVQVEHIIAFSLSLDDSFSNKTLCFVEENARKGKRTPWEACGRVGGPEWDAMLERVKRFNSGTRAKLRRFQMKEDEVKELLSNFSTQQLNDTRYASKQAAKYVAKLYGGINPRGETQRVFVSRGELTAMLRRLWGLNGVLGGNDGEKSRDDHRPHAIDAVVVACTDQKWVKRTAEAAEMAWATGQRRLRSLESPWDGFREDVKNAIEKVVVSHRVDHRLGGALHEETNYRKRHTANGVVVTVRKQVSGLSPAQLKQIADPRVRERVELQLGLVGGDPKKLVNGNEPTLETKDGRRIPIRRVRIRIPEEPRPVGSGVRKRFVTGGDNQHFEIYAVLDKDGKVKKYGCAIVSKHEAVERAKQGVPVVKRDHVSKRFLSATPSYHHT